MLRFWETGTGPGRLPMHKLYLRAPRSFPRVPVRLPLLQDEVRTPRPLRALPGLPRREGEAAPLRAPAGADREALYNLAMVTLTIFILIVLAYLAPVLALLAGFNAARAYSGQRRKPGKGDA